MALPTEAEIQAQIANVVDFLEDLRLEGHVNSPSVISRYDTIVTSLELPNAPEVVAALDRAVGAYAETVTPALAKAALSPLFETYAQVQGLRVRTVEEAIDELRENLIGSETVESRAISYASASAGGGNTGTGTVLRLTTDPDTLTIENTTVETKTVECVADWNNGRPKHQEKFLIRGASRIAERWPIDLTASGIERDINALSARDSEELILNPSFDRFSATGGTLTDFPGWTAATGSYGTEIERDETNYYRDYESAADNVSLKFASNGKVTQSLEQRRGVINPRRPYYCQIAYNREIDSGDGTLTLRLGGVSKAVTLSAQTGWNILRIDVNEDCWFDNWNEDTLDVEIELSSRTTGSVVVDDLILAPFRKIDGVWWAVVGGATRFLRDDIFTFADTETGSKIQYWIWRAFGSGDSDPYYRLYLPSSGTPSWSDP